MPLAQGRQDDGAVQPRAEALGPRVSLPIRQEVGRGLEVGLEPQPGGREERDLLGPLEVQLAGSPGRQQGTLEQPLIRRAGPALHGPLGVVHGGLGSAGQQVRRRAVGQQLAGSDPRDLDPVLDQAVQVLQGQGRPVQAKPQPGAAEPGRRVARALLQQRVVGRQRR
ncbi:MAG: hypothetical protein U0790_11115 [Isosphaeraceae bacterium]